MGRCWGVLLQTWAIMWRMLGSRWNRFVCIWISFDDGRNARIALKSVRIWISFDVDRCRLASFYYIIDSLSWNMTYASYGYWYTKINGQNRPWFHWNYFLFFILLQKDIWGRLVAWVIYVKLKKTSTQVNKTSK